MRYFVRNQIQELLPTLIEAVEYINNTKYESHDFIYEDFKSGIDSINHSFEESFTEETYALYNKKVIEIKNDLEVVFEKKQLEKSTKKDTKKIKDLLNSLASDLMKEEEVKLEVLFIPYKYSMWDSLESIWEAADNDPRCNAFVMPIPYYDRTSDGMLGEFHYEAESFIENEIPIVSYEQYNYMERRPDVIYFHNPYDGNNRVTSVAPEFYSSVLKNYTEMLVYVPYFVAGAFSALESARGFCQLPGVTNADKVIVQSEVHREVFIGNNISKEKLVVLGNPKIDALYKLDKKTNIPEEWDRLVDEKVLLLNSSIFNLLNEKEYMTDLKERIKCILNKEHFSLIWRPHPLFESTLQSMKKEQYEEYKRIKELVIQSPKAIIDNSPDIFPAMQFSDALITDSSSLIQSYIMTKKPVYILYGKERRNGYLCSDIGSCYIDKEFDLEIYLEMIKEDKDPKKELRYNNFINSIENSDGTSGKKIHSHIIQEILIK